VWNTNDAHMVLRILLPSTYNYECEAGFLGLLQIGTKHRKRLIMEENLRRALHGYDDKETTGSHTSITFSLLFYEQTEYFCILFKRLHEFNFFNYSF
jgi:hypothetical protein